MSSSQLFLLGEGDFSFSYSLPNMSHHELFPESFDTIIASSLDDRDEVINKYPNFVDMKFSSKISIFHSVNALDVSSWPLAVNTDFTVLWNHPHLGTENAIEHYQLMCHFFSAISPSQFRVIISLIDGQFDRWNVREAASKFGWYLRQSPVLFNTSAFPGYQARRNLVGASFKNTPAPKQTHVSFFYVFGRTQVDVVPATAISREVQTNFFACDFCGKKIPSSQGMKTHVRQVHELKKYTDTEFRECEICGDEFRGEEALRNHQVGTHEFRAKMNQTSPNKRTKTDDYCCSICGSDDVDHVARFGRNSETEMCLDCGKKFRDKRALFQHTSQIHSR